MSSRCCNYKPLKDTWVCNAPRCINDCMEGYSPAGERYFPAGGLYSEEEYAPVTLSLPEWRQYVSSGMNTLLGSGGVIPGGTIGGGAVISGRVRQGIPY